MALKSPSRRVIALLLAVLGLWSISIAAWAGDAPEASEEQIKAAFLLNFSRYVEWPTNAFQTPDSPIVFAVIGDNKIATELERLTSGRTVRGRAIVVRRIALGDADASSQILFVASGQKARLGELLAKFAGAGVLTVGEEDGFLEGGGIINLAVRDRKIALEVNLAAANASGIKISSKLLSVASVVKGKAD